VQLPPSLAFDEPVARAFFAALRERHGGPVQCEPRHPSWFGRAPTVLLREARIARVAADPSRVPAAAIPGGWRGFTSAYSCLFLRRLGPTLRADARRSETWCVFDNTAAGAALGDARALRALLAEPGRSARGQGGV